MSRVRYWYLSFRLSFLDRKSTRLNSSHSQISFFLIFFNDTATTEIYPLSLHDALPIYVGLLLVARLPGHVAGQVLVLVFQAEFFLLGCHGLPPSSSTRGRSCRRPRPRCRRCLSRR